MILFFGDSGREKSSRTAKSGFSFFYTPLPLSRGEGLRQIHIRALVSLVHLLPILRYQAFHIY